MNNERFYVSIDEGKRHNNTKIQNTENRKRNGENKRKTRNKSELHTTYVCRALHIDFRWERVHHQMGFAIEISVQYSKQTK